ncbi:MAG: nucleotide sugar dehydrogenase [Candidatus Kerfeldbacteria bacterium]|nr:nucleotide sugar dehydrogenase [Candidatus Kerfeldbacteria bacterium]
MKNKNRQRPNKRSGRPSGTVAIVGLGYVGLPLACLASEKGWRVFGIARDPKKIAQINAGVSPVPEAALNRWLKRVNVIATDDFSVVRKASIIVVAVPTPVDEFYNPDLTPIRNACEGIRPFLRRGQTVILESTVNPGVCEEVIKPILEKSRFRVGRNIFLAHCPERIDPGNRRWTVRNIPRVLGATDQSGLSRALAFYQGIIEAPIKPMRSIKEAEAVKIFENSFRDVNIAFVNEMAKSFSRLGIDTLDVIAGAKTKPFAFLAHYPAAGIGGHCIPVDPYYLIERAKRSGFEHEFLKLARQINNSMPAYTVDLLIHVLNEQKIALNAVRVGILGLAYKANVADTRESPSFKVISILKEYGSKFEIFDPRVPLQSTVRTLTELLKKCRALILMTDHEEFRHLDPRRLKQRGIVAIIDGKNALDKERFLRAGIAYRGIGR